MELDLLLVSTFLVLVEEQHFGRAAAQLHLTSSALTKRVQRLERQVGAVLVERGPAGVYCMTAAGRRFADAARPLLAHADAVRSAARRPPDRYTVRIGFPAGGLADLAQCIPFAAIARDVRLAYPEARFTCREIPFPALNQCLPDGAVDVLWTNAPVHHVQVDSFPLRVSSELVGVVPALHPLAERCSVEVSEFCAQPILYNPTAPDEWMRPFWLADIRPRREARLVETYRNHYAAVLHELVSGSAVMTTVAMGGPALGPALRPITLVGAARMRMHAACRRGEARGAVHALITAFAAAPADACP
jgi:DNA-binding transcriptional LysR family regulator